MSQHGCLPGKIFLLDGWMVCRGLVINLTVYLGSNWVYESYMKVQNDCYDYDHSYDLVDSCTAVEIVVVE